MGIFFGTDGIRGVVNEDLNFDIAYRCGNALASEGKKVKIIIGRDTRVSGSYLTLAFAVGAMNGGADVVDIGVIPTAGISYLITQEKADYGVIISASHNPADYNGIKIFDKSGYKLGDKREEALERKFMHSNVVDAKDIGVYTQDFSMVKKYEQFLIDSCNISLDGLTIVLDGSNGAASRVAPVVFRALGAKVIATNCREDGAHINDNCGSLYPENLAKKVLKYKADAGFAFDGDSDRLIAVDETGAIQDGDKVVFVLAKDLKAKGLLRGNAVVGTSNTNMGIKEALEKDGIELLRVDIGDKYVIAKLIEKNLSLGGEQSGHIICKNIAGTGDGILSAIQVAKILAESKKKFSELAKVDLYPQSMKNVIVSDKLKVVNNESLKNEAYAQEKLLGDGARVMVRASGTEPKIRIIVESKNAEAGKKSAEVLAELVEKIDNEI